MFQKIKQRWDNLCVVAATGPSLTSDIADQCRHLPVVVVNDAYRVFPFADILYACDIPWWEVHEGAKDFTGEKWSSHGSVGHNNKLSCAEKYGLSLVRGEDGVGFCRQENKIHYGSNAGFQGVNLAAHFLGWKGRIVLVGFDMKATPEKRHFFGNHPASLHREKDQGELNRYFRGFIDNFKRAVATVPSGLEIVNSTPGSALTCFRYLPLNEAVSRGVVHV